MLLTSCGWMLVWRAGAMGAQDGVVSDEVLVASRAVAPLVAECADEAERDRELPARLVAALADAGLFKMWVPAAFGGTAADFAALVDGVIEVGRIDGSAGWVVFVHAVYGALAAYLPEDTASEIYTPPDAMVSGTLNPSGKAVPTDGGYVVTGRWPFGSGVTHSTWVLGNCIVQDPTRAAGAKPELIVAMFPRRDCEVHDTWHVSGLRGTGSHDYGVADLYVPAERTFPAFTAPPRADGALYRAPFITLFAATVAAPALGIARGAIDTAVEVAVSKTPTGGSGLLRDRAGVQSALARAEGLFQAGRATLIDAVSRMLQRAETGSVSLHDRALVRIATAQAAAAAAAAVELAFNVAGSSANRLDNRLQRFSRDVHAATQHIAVVEHNFELAGRVLVGLEPGTARF